MCEQISENEKKFSDFLEEGIEDYEFGKAIDEIMAGTHDSKSCKLCQAVRKGEINFKAIAERIKAMAESLHSN